MQVTVKRTGYVFFHLYTTTVTDNVNGTDIEASATFRDRDRSINEALSTYQAGADLARDL